MRIASVFLVLVSASLGFAQSSDTYTTLEFSPRLRDQLEQPFHNLTHPLDAIWKVKSGQEDADREELLEGCIQCHTSGGGISLFRTDAKKFVQEYEASDWVNNKHALSYALIHPNPASIRVLDVDPATNRIATKIYEPGASNDLSRAICDNLGISNFDQAQQCLSCHAGWSRQAPQPSPQLMTLGVSCEACHGPSQQWWPNDKHARPDWRLKSPAEKEALGQLDLRNPIVAARKCASCHIGNVAEGKVLTHAMYVAGHPILPSFEYETFVREMPRHWRDIKEKEDFQHRQKYIELNYPIGKQLNNDGKAVKLKVQRSLIGAFVAKRESVSLTVDLAELALSHEQQSNSLWPEFAAFDCIACHHELTHPSRRQQRALAEQRTPGRPFQPAWTDTLLAMVPARGQLPALRAAFDNSFMKNPFGDPQDITVTGLQLINSLDATSQLLNERVVKEPTARSLIRALLKVRPQDLHSARQLGWAIDAMIGDIERLEEELRPALQKLRQRLYLDLPAQPTSEEVTRQLPEFLGKIYSFETADFDAIQAALDDLAAAFEAAQR